MQYKTENRTGVKMRWAIWSQNGSELVDVYATKKDAMEALQNMLNPDGCEIGRW